MARFIRPTLPGIFPSFFSIIFGVLLGGLLGVLVLVFKPVTVTDVLAPGAELEKKKGDEVAVVEPFNNVAVTRGKFGLPYTPQSAARQRAFLEKNPAGVELIEEDVNRWLVAGLAGKEPVFVADPERKVFKPKAPTVRFDGGEIELLLETPFGEPVKKKAEKGKKAEVIEPLTIIIHTRGTLEVREGRAVYVPKTVHVGSCPVFGEYLQKEVLKIALEPVAITPEAQAAWEAVRDVRIEGNRLKAAFN